MRTQQDWIQVQAILHGRGQQTEAITLSDPQHADLTQHISEVLFKLTEIPQPQVILVGHSYAGFVITGVASQAPERLTGLVYLDSALPRPQQSLWQLFQENGSDAAQFGVPPWPAFTQPLDFDPALVAPIAKTYIRCLQSQFRQFTALVSKELEARAQREPWQYLEIDSDHYCMLNQPQELARLLLRCQSGPDSDHTLPSTPK
ncbi:MAG: alpha/beta hydrolase [Desulfarculaceae bacterium]